jgi:pyruvate-formate lyase-activating enzyme
VRQVNLLPFHRTGFPKARRLGQDNAMAETQPPSAESMARAVEIFGNLGLTVKSGG